MIKARCPICSKGFEADPKALPPGFPFCSERCRLVDLGRWIDGDYVIPGRPIPPDGGRSNDAAAPDPDSIEDDAEDS